MRVIFALTFLFLLFLSACSEKKNEFQQDELPVINIQFDDEILINEKANVILSIVQDGNTRALLAKAHRRGGYSIIYSKYSYEIDLEKKLRWQICRQTMIGY